VKSITNTTFLLEIIIEAVAENATMVAEMATEIQNTTGLTKTLKLSCGSGKGFCYRIRKSFTAENIW